MPNGMNFLAGGMSMLPNLVSPRISDRRSYGDAVAVPMPAALGPDANGQNRGSIDSTRKGDEANKRGVVSQAPVALQLPVSNKRDASYALAAESQNWAPIATSDVLPFRVMPNGDVVGPSDVVRACRTTSVPAQEEGAFAGVTPVSGTASMSRPFGGSRREKPRGDARRQNGGPLSPMSPDEKTTCFSSGALPGPLASTDWKEDVQDAVMDANLGDWHLIMVEEVKAQVDFAAMDGSPGVIVAGMVSTLRHVPEIVAEITKERRQLQCIVLIVGNCPSSSNFSQITQAQNACFAVGADDVIFAAAKSVEAYGLELSMSLQRVKRRRQDQSVWNKKIQHLIRDGPHVTTNRAGSLDNPQHNKLFWSCVHRIFEGFPKIEADSAAEVLETGCRVGKCILGEKLGEGAFGSVFSSHHYDNLTPLAVKVLAKTRINDLVNVRSVWREFTLLQKLRHPGIVRLYGVIHTRHHICITMEDAGRATLWDAIDAHYFLEEPDIWDICGQVAIAIGYIHRLGIAHRDLKHENIVLSEDESRPRRSAAKIVDFGLALEVSKARLENVCGTMPFAAPEVLKAIGASSAASMLDLRATDIWAFGVIVLDAACGLRQINRLLGWPEEMREAPEKGVELANFFARDRRSVMEDIFAKNAGDDVVQSPTMSPALQDLLFGIFQVEPECRWDITEIVEWFEKQHDEDYD